MYLRFTLLHRLVHAGLMLGVLTALVSGLPLRFSTSSWARSLIGLLGGLATARQLHRGAASLLALCAVVHVGYFAYRWLWCRHTGLFWGPDSLVPQPRDWRDFGQHMRWFCGYGPRPQFDRWTYWQKFDYWAACLGMIGIGTTGVVLWFGPFFSQWLPGWMITVCLRLHSHEAILALGVISLFHFFHVHLHPEKFPVDPVIFSGRLDVDTFRRDHALQYKRLQEFDAFASWRIAASPAWIEKVVRTLWIIPVGLCWLLFILTLWALIQG